MVIWLDPEPAPALTGLQRGRCGDCGAPALVDAAYAGAVRCSACWARWTDATPGAGWRARPRYAGGDVAATSFDSKIEKLENRKETLRSPATFRVLTPARPATPGETPAGARALTSAILPPRGVRLVYALAEELATGRLLHSCTARVYDGDGRSLGYAVWINNNAAGATWWNPLRPKLGVAEFTALATDATYVPRPPRQKPPEGPCWRCGRIVRWRIPKGADGIPGAPEPYVHNRELAAEGGQRYKERCA